ncbi:MAG: hypothetical protein ACPHN2_05505 [Sinimarinibacterium flocculans]|uniref:hypothetical protein n=1 Tax=Sinimarinibacterium flocculans TaxID=985250 RepID=UPI003C5895DF
MKNTFITILATSLLATVFLFPVNANTQVLGTCLVDSLNGKERKELARWIYFAIAAHPEMTPFSKVSTSDRLKSDEYVGSLVTRLFVENCASELVEAQKADPRSVEKAFELVGNVAMQELLNDPGVMSAITNYARFVDQSRINSLFVD